MKALWNTWKAKAELFWSRLDEPQRRRCRTGAVVALAALSLWVLWNHYMLSPWTRDGRVRAEVVKVAPEVSGTVAEVRVADNQFVHKGDVLFVVDPARFQLALAQAEAAVALREADFKTKDSQARRRVELSQAQAKAISQDEMQTYQALADMASAAYDQAVADRGVARLNMERSVLVSPVNGYVTNLTLRPGDFAPAGAPQLSIVDSDSFYVVGYFEETKLRRIRDRARVAIHLMQGGPGLDGHVEGVSRGITDLNAAPASEGLANVNPVFTWVRLAQRIPVRIAIDRVPEGVRIVSGLTCTLTVDEWRRPLPPSPPPADEGGK
ncbi:RND family efflux transporter, MFP subunit [Verrucomicrobium sp. GAS474]|uniref:efflux RND transporter periplasmic adaptor subunit n=1 Tax=Verrucomicrobium sp. GAS474 TaxID=1882831 RepID=UPI00087A5CE2|nr:HlyD family secretion protein [Verrucomicrobium sp. GAS474]SDT95274.1 RND family efflux transporter, MFP subunit [Verrucomicrobium sp. GAS474]